MSTYKRPTKISFYKEYLEEKKAVLGYYYKDFFEMIDDKIAKIKEIKEYCKRTNKTIKYQYLYSKTNGWELQITIIQNAQPKREG